MWVAVAAVLAATGLLVTSCRVGTDDVGPNSIDSLGVDSPGPAAQSDPAFPTVASWTPCGEGVECTVLTVPVDWGNPDGTTIDLAVIRRPSIGASLGPLVINPGGPGASGVQWLQTTSRFDGLNERFDLVSWDPRGVGHSTRLDCGGVGGPEGTDVHRASPIGPDTDANLAAAKELAEACALGSPELAGNMGTNQTVGDIEAIRVALAVPQISFVGFSYGTYLGLAYAQRFGPQVRAMVLDGVVDPALDLPGLLAAQLSGMEPYIATITTTADGTNLFDQAAATAGADLAVLSFAAIASVYDPRSATVLQQALVDAIAGDSTGLEVLANRYWSAASFTAYLATLCSDTSRPADEVGYRAMAAALSATAPRLGPAVAGEVAGCTWWAAPPGTDGPATVGAGAPPLLVVGATGDLATPLALARSVHASLQTSALVIHNSPFHTSFGTSLCVDSVVTNYLVDLMLPADPTVCNN
jgi:pimeloyl-ACP methyl ester carboxylesterase